VLTAADESRLLGAMRNLYTLSDMATYPRRVIAALGTLLPARFITYNEVNPDASRNRYVWWPPGTRLRTGSPLYRMFERHVAEHPLVTHYARTSDPRPLTISDFLTRPQFHRLNLYKTFYKRLGVEYQLAVTLPGPKGVVIGIALSRGDKDFSQRERHLLALLRPHLIQAYANAAMATHFKRRRPAGEHGPRHRTLSRRQAEVLSWVARGKTNDQIGAVLDVSPRTIQKHLEHVFEKLGVETRTAAVMRAIEMGEPIT
jgi:DNA-binding CsgD family transcriptional regulator